MNQCVPADSSRDMGDAFTQSCGQDDGLIELLWCGGHVVMQRQPPPWPEHEAMPWFQYPVVDDHDGSLDEDLFSKLFGGMPEDDAGRACQEEQRGAAGTPLQGGMIPTRENARFWDDAGEVVMAKEAGDGESPVLKIGSRSVCGGSSQAQTPCAACARTTTDTALGAGKRKRRDATESSSEDVEDSKSAAMTTRGLARRPTTGKRRRAAQKHNLSERRRRGRINDKMRALQELVPHCNKFFHQTDKASMLDEAIDYLKSLQLQVQMMWTTGGGLAPAPTMFSASGAHRYMQRVASMRSRMPPFRTCVYSSNDTKLS